MPHMAADGTGTDASLILEPLLLRSCFSVTFHVTVGKATIIIMCNKNATAEGI